MFSIHIFIQYGIICPFAQFPTFIHYKIISCSKYQKYLQTFIRVQFSQHSFNTKNIKKRSWGFMYTWSKLYFYSVRLLTMTLRLHGLLLLNLFTRYLRDDKNNVLSIFMLSGSVQFSLHLILAQIMQLF